MAASSRPLFTIVTPAWQGARFLGPLHAALEAMAADSPPFEWIIVDDASQDGGETAAEMRRIEREAGIPVRCIFLERNHLGSRSAWEGSLAAHGDWLVILDQDDRLTPDALQIYARWIARYGERPDFAGVCGRCVDQHGRFIGTPLPTGTLYTDELSMRHRHRIRGEMLQCTRVALIREHFAAMAPGVTNGLVWRRIAATHRYLYTDEVVRHYDTGNPVSWTNCGRILYVGDRRDELVEYLERALGPMLRDPVELLRTLVHARRFDLLARRAGLQPRRTARASVRALMTAVTPLAWPVARLDRHRRRVSAAGWTDAGRQALQ